MKKLIKYALVFCVLINCFSAFSDSKIQVVNLKIETRTNPLGIDAEHPRFSWQLVSNQSITLQSAYQILVAEAAEKLLSEKDLVWNSGKVESGISVLIPFNGKKLESTKN